MPWSYEIYPDLNVVTKAIGVVTEDDLRVGVPQQYADYLRHRY